MPPGKSHECPRCGHRFRVPEELRRHLNNKRPCVSPSTLAAGKDAAGVADLAADVFDHGAPRDRRRCRYCLRLFAQASNVLRHQREACPLAPGSKRAASTVAPVASAEKSAPLTAADIIKAQAEKIATLEKLVAELSREVQRCKNANLVPRPGGVGSSLPARPPDEGRAETPASPLTDLCFKLGEIISLSDVLDVV